MFWNAELKRRILMIRLLKAVVPWNELCFYAKSINGNSLDMFTLTFKILSFQCAQIMSMTMKNKSIQVVPVTSLIAQIVL